MHTSATATGAQLLPSCSVPDSGSDAAMPSSLTESNRGKRDAVEPYLAISSSKAFWVNSAESMTAT